MALTRRKRPRDPMQLAKMIGDIATGQTTDEVDEKHTVKRARKGGTARAKKLSAAERTEIASLAASARWKKR